METKNNSSRFMALSRMCLNNWHYIERKILSFHKEINFFTGHSGSGKSTVIDALQIVLYANTDGRGFFNKAAAEDSDRSLVEYLRGMVNIEDNNESAYLRNRNFSSTIVLEFTRSDNGEQQCVGVVFDVETATNEIARYFFWHRGGLLDNAYRIERRPMSTEELKEFLGRTFEKNDYYTTSRNESFRRRLYDDYLGGLDMEKFPMLFKRAIPFKMNSKLENFVREYICMEQDIHIEDMQESVMQYGRMQKKIMDTRAEIGELAAIGEKYRLVQEQDQELGRIAYFGKKFGILGQRQRVEELEQRAKLHSRDMEALGGRIGELEQQKERLKGQRDELIRLIAKTGYQEAVDQLRSLNLLLERMEKSREKWRQTAAGLKQWADNDMASNAILWNIQRFDQEEIDGQQLRELKEAIAELMEEVAEEKDDLGRVVKELKGERRRAEEELSELHRGSKAYPKEVEQARQLVYQGLAKRLGRAVRVEVLADLVDIADERWRNAVEGYMGAGKLLLVVEPAYAGEAMAVYRELDSRKYHKVAVLDTERITAREHRVREGALTEAVRAKTPYVQAYLDYLLGGVMKCDSMDEMREHEVAVTDDCMRYQGCRLSHMNPDSYTRGAYIGAESRKRRISLLKKHAADLDARLAPKEAQLREYERMQAMEQLGQEPEEYMEWLSDMQESKGRQKEKERLTKRILELQQKDVAGLRSQKEEIEEKLKTVEGQLLEHYGKQTRLSQLLEHERQERIDAAYRLTRMEQEFEPSEELEKEAELVEAAKGQSTYEQLEHSYNGRLEKEGEKRVQLFQALAEERGKYLKAHPNRGFKQFSEDNGEYEALLSRLQFQELERFQALAGEQAKSAVEHFQNDFIYKIRSAITDAMARKDELNRVIDKLDFGKDKYRFVFTRNQGEDGKYYDMFMDPSLEINPNQLSDHMENQLNLFTMEHDSKYGEMLNELMAVFIPPVNASSQEQEEARRNMEKYADYRTYLSFDMQQIIQGEKEQIRLKLSRMLKKNSGGRGRTLYMWLSLPALPRPTGSICPHGSCESLPSAWWS